MLTTEVKYTLVDDLSAKVAKIEDRLKKFDRLIGHTDDNLKKLGKHGTGGFMDKLLPNNTKVEKITGALSEIPNLNMGILSSAGTLANPYVAAGAAAVAFGAYAVKSTKMALNWNEGMARANSTMGASPAELEKVSQKLQKMPRYGADLLAIPDAFEKILSTVGDTGKSLDILSVALKSSRANMASLDVTSDAIANILGSAGSQFNNVMEVSDLLTKTKILGAAEFNDMATYLPRIIPYANRLGIEVTEVSGALALLTAHGQKTEQAAMLLQNSFVALGDPKKRANIEKYIKVFDKGKMRPFADIIEDIKGKMKSLNNEGKLKFLGTLDLDQQAASSFQQLIDNSEELKGNIEELKKAGGATEKSFIDTKNTNDGLDRLKGKWDDMTLALGKKIAPFWNDFTHGLADLSDWLVKVEEKTGFFSSAWKVVINVIKWARLPFVSLWNIGKALFGWAVRFGTFLHNDFPVAFQVLGKAVRVVTGFISDLFFVLSETFDLLTNLVTFDWGKLGDNVDNFKNRDWATNGTKDPIKPLTEDEAMAVYAKASKTYGKDKIDAMAKKWGVAIPGTATAPKDVPTTNTGASLMPTGTGMDDEDKKKAKHKADRAEQGLREVAGGGAQVRNVTIHIGKQIEKVEIATTNLQNLSKEAIRKILEELMVTTVRDSEIMLAH